MRPNFLTGPVTIRADLHVYYQGKTRPHLASSEHSGSREEVPQSEGQEWRKQEHRPKDSASDYRPHQGFLAFSFYILYSPQASFKDLLGLKLQHVLTVGNIDRGPMQSWLLCLRPA